MRKDVSRLAEQLSKESGISATCIYEWLMDLGRLKGSNPCKLTFSTLPGTVWHDAENYLRVFNPETGKPYDNMAADYWEDRILVRQEAWID